MSGRAQPSSPKSIGEDEPFWKRLFAPGGFEWAFRMRKGDAAAFFSPHDASGELLRVRGKQLDAHPERYLASTPAGDQLTEEAWKLAPRWGASAGSRDLQGLSRQLEADLLMLDQATKLVAAAAVCFPSSWDPVHAIGKPLDEVHGVVPRLNPQIGKMINQFVEKISPGDSFRRENWSFTRTADLDYHPALKRRRLDESLTLDEVFLRIEHQLFTGIPGGVLMGIRIETCPLKDLAADADVWQLAAEKIRTMPDDVAKYKSMDAAIPRMLEVMDGFRATGQER